MTISVNPVYANNALSLKVYEVSDTTGCFGGQLAVTYDKEVFLNSGEFIQDILDGFAYISPADSEGYAKSVTRVGCNLTQDESKEADTISPMKDALVLIVQDLFE